jgi:predicted DNA-binding mobile mystery protein A
MRNKKSLLITQLDQKLKPFATAKNTTVPTKGWLHTIRTSLNMTMEQLGNKLSITKQGVKKIEESEIKGTISINSLKEVANALDMQLVYGFVPNKGSVKEMIAEKAEKLATKIVLRTHKNMQLENQAITDTKIKSAIKELAEELAREMKKLLWD